MTTSRLKQKKFVVPLDKIFFLFVLEMAIKLREEIPGATVTGVYSINTSIIGKRVKVLPTPMETQKLRNILVGFDPKKKMETNEIVFEYYDSFDNTAEAREV